jgi:TolB-like protein
MRGLKNNIKYLFLRGVSFVLLALTVSCGAAGNYYVRPQYDLESIKRIAVLPFENYTQDNYAGVKIREKVVIELLERGFEVVEEGEVLRVLSELKVEPVRMITLSDIQSLGSMLGVDAVMKGSAGELIDKKGISVSYPEVAINLKLIDVASGDIVWSVSHSGGGPGFWTRHFGTEGDTLDEAAEKVVKEAVNTLN